MATICKTEYSTAIKLLVDLIEDCFIREKMAQDNAMAFARHLQEARKENWVILKQELVKENLIKDVNTEFKIMFKDKIICTMENKETSNKTNSPRLSCQNGKFVPKGE